MLTLTSVTKSYTAGQPVLRNITLDVAEGEVVCLLGPSGCGKSTLLRIIAGLEQADQGTLMIDGRELSTIPVHRRHFGLMFQDFALFPHRTVTENVAFGLRMAGMGRQAIVARVAEVLALVSLRGYEERSIFALSGGERQRVALARSLAPNPRLLMLDEPLGSLDRTLRDDLVTELRTILKTIHVTALYVTHDQQEAFTIADRLVVMRKGEIEQVDTPTAVYQRPANAFVARFLGFHNVLPIRELAAVAPTLLPPTIKLADGNSLLMIRPDAVTALRLGTLPATHGAALQRAEAPVLTGEIQQMAFLGAAYRLLLVLREGPSTGHPATVRVPADVRNATAKQSVPQQLSFDIPTIQLAPHLEELTVGATVTLWLEPSAISLIRP